MGGVTAGSSDHPTIKSAIRSSSARLAAAGIEDAGIDARRLLCHALGCEQIKLLTESDRLLSAEETARFEAMLVRRSAREPVSRIMGRRDFYGRTFMVTPGVLDPRPDTETLVEETLRIAHEPEYQGRPLSILDIGTGSGAILLTLLAELPQASGLGIDVSADALTVASANAAALGLCDRARFELVDMSKGLPEGYDIWVSNPPYIPAEEITGLDPEVREYDPRLALDGGTDGLDAYRHIVAGASGAAAPRWLAMEFGAGQSEAICALTRELRPVEQTVTRDLGGHDRCVAVKLHDYLK